jgi:predicted nucleotidyltransferase
VPSYPGTPAHQRILAAVAASYVDDPRVRAVCVFGSLGRGTWDEHSDVDLDVVIADGARVDPSAEVRRLCAAIGEEPVVVGPDGDHAVDVVLSSLTEMSVRFHPLSATSPNIVDSLVVIAGSLGDAAIRAAGLANTREPTTVAGHVGSCLRLAVTLDGRLHRRQLWLAHQTLYLARLQLLLAYARARGGSRPYHVLEADPDPSARTLFARTLAGADLPSIHHACLALLDVLGNDLTLLTAGQVELSQSQRRLVTTLRDRQERLHL